MPQWVTGGEGFLPLVGFFNLSIIDLEGFLSSPFTPILLISKPQFTSPHPSLPPCSLTTFGCSDRSWLPEASSSSRSGRSRWVDEVCSGTMDSVQFCYRYRSTSGSLQLYFPLLSLSNRNCCLSLWNEIIIAIMPVLLESEKIRDVEFERFREWKQQIAMRGLHDFSPGLGFQRGIRIAYKLHLCGASPSENAVPVAVCNR
ncbi:hypothetical protein RHMOL_Rhmol10G0224900 [Rhododendron molle]|uniref:Uncharacterized protein n=1 Tax=Rhododendron molle TaxID=49168 RepID=A0ACC0M5K5_RHOML|nr:hypothetical protein RHMOL_Rhmol10G0224900 [Rhododendron molle]